MEKTRNDPHTGQTQPEERNKTNNNNFNNVIMKKIKFLAMMLAAGMMAACSDSLEETTGGNGNQGPVYDGDRGYVNISLNLPTTSGANTRANDNFDDGLAAEYNVNNAIIALFYGANEATAVCKYAFELDETQFNKTGEDGNITSYYASGVRMIEAPEEGQHVYALAILNKTDYFKVTTSTNATKENTGDDKLSTKLQTLTTAPDTYTDFTGTLSGLQTEATVDLSKIASTADQGRFFMTNAPIASAPSFASGSAPQDFKVTTLAPITIYNDKEVATGSAPANPIYVERAVAKVTVTVPDDKNSNTQAGELEVKSEVPAYDGAIVSFASNNDGWKLQNTNKKFYYVRKVTDSNNTYADWEDWKSYYNGSVTPTEINRFFGQTANPYRTYWGIDPNYGLISDNFDSEFNIIDPSTPSLTWNKTATSKTTTYENTLVEYCAENTTIAKAMNGKNLTGVLIKATFKPKNMTGTDFFMINNTSAIYDATGFLLFATDALKQSSITIDGQLELKNNLTTGTTVTDATGVKSLIQVDKGGTDTELSNEQANAIIAKMGNDIKYYKDGVCYYYSALIEHFSNGQTPLADDKKIENVTEYEEAKHLGRWGVVRNNWYELNITSVSGPGTPTIPDIPDEPADKTSSYINCQINVLSWAKRSQDVDL